MLLAFRRISSVMLWIILVLCASFLAYNLFSFSRYSFIQDKRLFINSLFLGAGVLFSASFIFTSSYFWVEKHLWRGVAFLSALLCFLIVAVLLGDYYLSENYLNLASGYDAANNTIIHDQADLDSYITKLEQELRDKQHAQPFYIPTACVIQWIDIELGDEFRANGYVWQIFNDKTKHLMSNELFLDDALEQTVFKSYQFSKNGNEIVGWHFTGTFAADFNFLKYPLDTHTLNFSFAHKNYIANQVFVPNFSSYDINFQSGQRKALIGISPDCAISNWTIKKSDFGYYRSPAYVDYGDKSGKQTLQVKLPWFILNVFIKREYVFLLLYCFTPLLIIFFILFCVVLFIGLEKLKLSDIVTYISGILFAILLSHGLYNDSLPELAKLQNTYFDFIYFLSYIYSVMVCVNGMLYYSTRVDSWPLIKYKHNIVMRVIYWPLLLLFILLATLYVYY